MQDSTSSRGHMFLEFKSGVGEGAIASLILRPPTPLSPLQTQHLTDHPFSIAGDHGVVTVTGAPPGAKFSLSMLHRGATGTVSSASPPKVKTSMAWRAMVVVALHQESSMRSGERHFGKTPGTIHQRLPEKGLFHLRNV